MLAVFKCWHPSRLENKISALVLLCFLADLLSGQPIPTGWTRLYNSTSRALCQMLQGVFDIQQFQAQFSITALLGPVHDKLPRRLLPAQSILNSGAAIAGTGMGIALLVFGAWQ
jgi:hypothetical protein